jgi:hypothetical protein
MDQKHIVSQHIGSLLCRDDLSVSELLGIQSQVLRYSKWAARVRGIDVDAEPIHTSYGIMEQDCVQTAEGLIAHCEQENLRLTQMQRTENGFFLQFRKVR